MEASPNTSQLRSDDAVIERVLTAVAETEGCDPLELPPIYEFVNPDALGQLTRGIGVTEISFSYYNYRVTIDGDYHVRVTSE